MYSVREWSKFLSVFCVSSTSLVLWHKMLKRPQVNIRTITSENFDQCFRGEKDNDERRKCVQKCLIWIWLWIQLSQMEEWTWKKCCKNVPSIRTVRLVPWPVLFDESFNVIQCFRYVFTEEWVFPLGTGWSVMSCSAHWATQHQQFLALKREIERIMCSACQHSLLIRGQVISGNLH